MELLSFDRQGDLNYAPSPRFFRNNSLTAADIDIKLEIHILTPVLRRLMRTNPI